MSKPVAEDIAKLGRYFAVESNNAFWGLAESDVNDQQKQDLLTNAFTSLYHWSRVGTKENVQLARVGVARALCINDSILALAFAQQAEVYFRGQGDDWAKAFAYAVLSHALLISGDEAAAIQQYQVAKSYRAKLSGQDLDIFDATFTLIPIPN